MKNLRLFELVALLLVVVGGLNWGLIGLMEINLVTAIFGKLARLVYVLVGVATGYLIFLRCTIK